MVYILGLQDESRRKANGRDVPYIIYVSQHLHLRKRDEPTEGHIFFHFSVTNMQWLHVTRQDDKYFPFQFSFLNFSSVLISVANRVQNCISTLNARQ